MNEKELAAEIQKHILENEFIEKALLDYQPGTIPLKIREAFGQMTGKRYHGFMHRGSESWLSEIAAITKNFRTSQAKYGQKDK